MITVYIDHSVIKELAPPLIFLLYLVHRKTRRLEWVFHIGILSLYGFSILYTLVHIRGHDLLGFVTSNWRTWATPSMYLVFILLVYGVAHTRTQDHPYSITLAVHMALATGYLYEAPRYMYLQGPQGLIRFSRYSVFRVQYAIVSLLIIVWMLYTKKMEVNPIVLAGIQNYEIYFLVFWIKYEWLQEIRFIHFYYRGNMIPWINLYRLPTMIMFILAASQLERKIKH